MTYLEALVLGIIQGLTEFLPVSSSGHLELGSVILGLDTEENLLMAVVLHLATALSTVVVFRSYLLEIFRGLLKRPWNDSWQFAFLIAISMIPVGIVGVFFNNQIEALFGGNLLLVGSMLLITGGLLLFTQFKQTGHGNVTVWRAVIMGLAQAFAVLPGISRSGSTIAVGLLVGVEKSKATQFSFLMVLVPIFGASLLKLKDYFESGTSNSGLPVLVLIVGFLAAFVSGYMACKWMVNIVKKGKLSYFAVYCFIVGLIAIGFYYGS